MRAAKKLAAPDEPSTERSGPPGTSSTEEGGGIRKAAVALGARPMGARPLPPPAPKPSLSLSQRGRLKLSLPIRLVTPRALTPTNKSAVASPEEKQPSVRSCKLEA